MNFGESGRLLRCSAPGRRAIAGLAGASGWLRGSPRSRPRAGGVRRGPGGFPEPAHQVVSADGRSPPAPTGEPPQVACRRSPPGPDRRNQEERVGEGRARVSDPSPPRSPAPRPPAPPERDPAASRPPPRPTGRGAAGAARPRRRLPTGRSRRRSPPGAGGAAGGREAKRGPGSRGGRGFVRRPATDSASPRSRAPEPGGRRLPPTGRPPRRASASSIFASSAWMRSGATLARLGAIRAAARRAAASGRSPCVAKKRAARKARTGSSVRFDSRTRRRRREARSSAPPKGSIQAPVWRSMAMALAVKSRRSRSLAIEPPSSSARSTGRLPATRYTHGDCSEMATARPNPSDSRRRASGSASPVTATSTSSSARPSRPSRGAPPTIQASTPRSRASRASAASTRRRRKEAAMTDFFRRNAGFNVAIFGFLGKSLYNYSNGDRSQYRHSGDRPEGRGACPLAAPARPSSPSGRNSSAALSPTSTRSSRSRRAPSGSRRFRRRHRCVPTRRARETGGSRSKANAARLFEGFGVVPRVVGGGE